MWMYTCCIVLDACCMRFLCLSVSVIMCMCNMCMYVSARVCPGSDIELSLHVHVAQVKKDTSSFEHLLRSFSISETDGFIVTHTGIARASSDSTITCTQTHTQHRYTRTHQAHVYMEHTSHNAHQHAHWHALARIRLYSIAATGCDAC